MESGYVTTPFGRRAMSLCLLKIQQQADAGKSEPARNKWKLFRAVCEARTELGIADRALTVLDALLSFYPEDTISREHGLIVFPSNAQLSIRARGMTPATLRRHLAVLVEAGLISRKDSPNGKRYARRGREGQIHDAYGFSLAPLLSRASEIEAAAAQAVADRELLRVTKERISICRRDITKLIGAAIEDHLPGDWEDVFTGFRALIDGIPRTAPIEQLTSTLGQLGKIRERIINQLEIQINLQNMSANESHIERHKQDSESSYLSESEHADEASVGVTSKLAPSLPSECDEDNARPVDDRQSNTLRSMPISPKPSPMKSLPLGLVLQACPQIADYAPGGMVRTWRDLMAAAVVVHTMLRVSPSAYQDACRSMGPEIAATIMACLLERGAHINSAGGYLRDLTRRAERGEFAVGPMLMALLRTSKSPEKQAG
ncbi:replication initiation protein RepC [Rhizobium sp. XQZ8]|uniref:plasmid replication protein RepC n=1 Tax=Rhizobium populisoli TaxID=2859785 RepID=UPI001CA5B61F|nr:plasmid replication protein RepC [Rhizobium populisoli]MBW6422157.1 replication initiation protein RepC [Rhizobium populisoli]